MKLKILSVPVLIALTITTASAQYQRTDLVSNQPGVAPNTDPHLVNAWGLVALPTRPARGDPWHANRYRRKYQYQPDRLYDHGKRRVGAVGFYFRDTRRYDQ